MQVPWITASRSMIWMVLLALPIAPAAAKEVTLPSVDEKLAAVISVEDGAQLKLAVAREGRRV